MTCDVTDCGHIFHHACLSTPFVGGGGLGKLARSISCETPYQGLYSLSKGGIFELLNFSARGVRRPAILAKDRGMAGRRERSGMLCANSC